MRHKKLVKKKIYWVISLTVAYVRKKCVKNDGAECSSNITIYFLHYTCCISLPTFTPPPHSALFHYSVPKVCQYYFFPFLQYIAQRILNYLDTLSSQHHWANGNNKSKKSATLLLASLHFLDFFLLSCSSRQ